MTRIIGSKSRRLPVIDFSNAIKARFKKRVSLYVISVYSKLKFYKYRDGYNDVYQLNNSYDEKI